LLKYHPDKCNEDFADGITKHINKIKATLCDPDNKVEYNKTLSEEKSKSQEKKGKGEKAEQKAREEAQQKAREEAQQKAREEAQQKAREEAQQKVEKERLRRRKEEERKKKGIFVFSLIFGILLIGVVAMFLRACLKIELDPTIG
jgi:molecular chaperone GrpE (heat shock protein)